MSYRDAHRIARKLWIGAAPFDCDGLESFDVIVLCARELQWIPTPCEAIRVPLDDGEIQQRIGLSSNEFDLALRAAKVIELLTQQNKRVLVTCAKGVNRSSFVAALVLMRRGLSAGAAIAQIRALRAPANGMTPFSNPAFVRQLQEIRRVAVRPTGAHHTPPPA